VAGVGDHVSDSTGDIVGVNGLKLNIVLEEASRDFAFVNALGDVMQKVGGLVAENKVGVQNGERLGVLQSSLFSILAHLNP